MSLSPISCTRLTSYQNPRLKDVAKLRTRRGRERQGRIVIDGQRAIQSAVLADVVLDDVYLSEDHLKQLTPDENEFLSGCIRVGTRVFVLSVGLLEKIGYGDRHDQWVATAAAPLMKLADVKLSDHPAIAILERVEKPGNLGAVLRSADATGIELLIVADGRTDLFNPNAIRASLGTIFTTTTCSATTAEVVEWLRRHNLATFVARVDGASEVFQCNLKQSCAVVFGSEADGVSDVWSDSEWSGLRLPMHGHADSLNVSNTAAVVFYELLRQRTL